MEDTERRNHRRLPREAAVTCQEVTYPLGRAPEVSVRMADVSEGGVKLECGTTWEVGTLLQVAVRLEGWQRHTASFSRYDEVGGSRPLTALGRVARSVAREPGLYEIGIEFVDIWNDHWRAVRLFLQGELGPGPGGRAVERERS